MQVLKALVAATVFLCCNNDASKQVPIGNPEKGEREEGGKEVKMLPMKKVEVLVGGCALDCQEPGLAVSRFLEMLAFEPESAARFLDTTALEVNGKGLGAEWAQMWRELRTATRKDAIREAVRELASWKDGLTDKEVRQALAEGAREVHVWSTQAVYEFKTPLETWVITLRPRGLEWLVTKIERRSGERR